MKRRKTNQKEKRLRILSDDEISLLYTIPSFTPEERAEYFSLTSVEKSLVQELIFAKSKICFVLQLGYFKARHMFFKFKFEEVEQDAKYIVEQYLPGVLVKDLNISKTTRAIQQHLIAQLCNYQIFSKQHHQLLENKAQQEASLCAKPIYILRKIISYLEQHFITLPVYSFLQDTVGKALTYEQRRLTIVIQKHLKPDDITALNRLLEDCPGLYEITKLKHEPKNFSASEIKHEIHRGQQMHSLYILADAMLPTLCISAENIKYYASLVVYYSVHRLKQLNEWVMYLYLLCFVHHRYRRLHDNLINCFIYKVRDYYDKAKVAAKEKLYEYLMENNQNLQKAGQVLKLFTDDSIEESTPFHQVQAKAFNILERKKLDFLAQNITKTASVDQRAFQWNHVDKLAKEFKLNLRPIIQNMEFSAISEHSSLIKAINFLKVAFQCKKSLSHYPSDSFPLRFAPTSIKRHLYGQNPVKKKYILVDRYEFLVYRFLRYALESKDVFCRDSVHFRSFEDELITDSQFQQKDKLIAETGLTILNQPIKEHLLALEQQFESRLALVNERISSKENSHFQIKKTGSHTHWTLQYPQNTESVNHSFFDLLEQINVADVILFVHQQTNFLAVFDHILGRYNKQELQPHIVIACFIAWATNTGLGKMSEISDITFQELSTTSDNFIRLETLRDANDLISNSTSKLPIFHHYDIGNTLHSSSDGQKFETQTDTINSRYSPKYFGLKKGIVSYSLVLNHVPINAKVIGANEHESASLFDIIHNNTTDIDPEIHSTDTHGSNQVNFAILHVFGYQFAPRYKDIYHKLNESLYGFKHPSLYPNDWIIKPIRKTLTDLIVDEWENIQRIFLSLALKTTTQSIIVSKLSSHSRKNKTQRALWEYDNIVRSLYLLDYINSPSLRQNVYKALNRGENYHKLRRAISFANFGKLRLKTEYEQNLWNECSRLLANCIIYYNASILSNLLIYKEKRGDNNANTQLKQISPVAWQHINLHGHYKFKNQSASIDMDSIIQQLAQSSILSEKYLN